MENGSANEQASVPQKSLVGKILRAAPWEKYLVLEVIIVVLIFGAVAIAIFNPFPGLFRIPQSKKVPKDMMFSVPGDGSSKGRIITPPAVFIPPKIVTIKIGETGFDPESVTASATGNIIRFQNDTVMPVVIEFRDNLLPEEKIPPNVSWDSPVLAKKGSFKYSVKDNPAKGGTIIIE